MPANIPIKEQKVIIVGGGLAGLITSVLLSRAGIQVQLIEKKTYPFHRVCGEYISNEVIPFLKANKIFPDELLPAQIDRFELTSINGKSHEVDLDLGGFGISRYSFDSYLSEIASTEGVEIITDSVIDIQFRNNHFEVHTKANGILEASIVIGAYGKRSIIDKQLNRSFIAKSSPYIGVKYHIKHNYPNNKVALHNFPNGYCGINAVEDNRFNLCYLSHRDNLKAHKNVEKMEEQVLFKNPHLKTIFHEAEFLFNKPEVINEISFETKLPVENHVLMCGDAAGMITPLCGNGMAMAIRSAKFVSEAAEDYFKHKDRNRLENVYTKIWNREFKLRLSIGRNIQKLFGKGHLSGVAVSLIKNKTLANKIIRLTHGSPFS